MKAPASLPIFGDAYLADTPHLTLEEHGAYFKLLLCAWRTATCELPLDDKRIATMLGVSVGKWCKLKPVVMAFWTRTETGWQQKRLTKERRFVDEKRAKNISAINSRWESKPLKTKKPDDTNEHTGVIPLSPTHLSKKKEPTPNGVGRAPASGTHLPEDWEPQGLVGQAAAIVARWQPGELERELSKFRDHWAAASGPTARKRDWQAAWRKWISNHDEWSNRNGNTTGHGPVSGRGPGPVLDRPRRASYGDAARELVAAAIADEAESPCEGGGGLGRAWTALPTRTH